MKYIIAIITLLIALSSCENDNPVVPQKVILQDTTKIDKDTVLIAKDSLFIYKISPVSGIPGDLISFIGKGFTNDSIKAQLFFENSLCSISQLNDTFAIANVPDLDSGYYQVSMKNSLYHFEYPQKFRVNYLSIDKIEPLNQITGGIVNISVSNYNSIKPAIVYFNSSFANIISTNDSLIQVKVPDNELGNIKITVRSNNQTAVNTGDLNVTKDMRINYAFVSAEVMFENFNTKILNHVKENDHFYPKNNFDKYDTLIKILDFQFKTQFVKEIRENLSLKDTVNYISHGDYWKNQYQIYCVIDSTNKVINNFKLMGKFVKYIDNQNMSHSQVIDIYQLNIKSFKYHIDNSGNYICEIFHQDLQNLEFDLTRDYESHSYDQHCFSDNESNYQVIGNSNNSQITIKLTPEN